MFMTGRITFIVAALFAATIACADDKAPVTLTGTGKGPVEVRDSAGEVTEVITQKSLTLNQIPADAVSREQAYREQQNERARELENERATEQRESAAAEAEAAKVAEEASAQAAAEAKAAAEEFDPTPRKVRRTTVRGTRRIATEPVDPSLRTPENTGIKPVASQQPAKSVEGAPTWPPARPSQQLSTKKPLPQYEPN
jgi:hypothetical protein